VSARTIVLVHYETYALTTLRFLIHECCSGAHLLLFENGDEALKQLSRQDPDLLIISDWMPSEPRGGLIVRRLADRNVQYPILVTTDGISDLLKQVIDSGLHPCVEAVSEPRTAAELWRLTSHALRAIGETGASLPPLEQSGDFLQLAIERDSNPAVAHHLLGQIHENAGRQEEAAEKFADAAHFDPNDGPNALGDWTRLAESDDGLQVSQVVNVLRKIVRKYPDDQWFKYELARARLRNDEAVEAVRLFRELLAHHQNQDLPAHGWSKGGWRWPNKEWLADVELELSWALDATGDVAGSVALVEEVLPRLGTHWDRESVEDKLADCYIRLGQFGDALKIYLSWLSHAPPTFGPTGPKARPLVLSGTTGTAPPQNDPHLGQLAQAGLLKLLDSVQAKHMEDALRIYLGWLGQASPSVGLTGRKEAVHLRRDSYLYDVVRAGLLRVLDCARKSLLADGNRPVASGQELSLESFGKLHLALSRCYEETGEPEQAERAYAKAMEYFGRTE
jgi:tetratricopeptide (TPR) repeat protein